MKVCLDIQPALAQRAGVGRYTRMLAEHLAEQRGGDQLELFYFDFKRVGCDFAPPGATQKPVRWIPGRYVQQSWKRFNTPPFNWLSGPADVYHFTNFIRPPLTRGKSVVSIHDASFIRHPETTEAKNYRYLTRCIRRTVEQADAIITISHFTANELASLLDAPRAKLFPIHCGLTANHQRAPAPAIDAVRKKHNLSRPYLLSVGTIEPRKNFAFLIDVFEQLPFDGDLVIAGMKGWKTEGFFERLKKSARRDRIRWLEYVDEADMPALYSGAELYVTPSLYEGFGFTPLEAMQCDTPVVASQGGSLPEVLGDAAVIVRDFEIDAWTTAVKTLLASPTSRAALIAKGKTQVAKYSWEENARQTWSVYRSLVP